MKDREKGFALVLALLFMILVTSFSTTLTYTAILNFEQMRNISRSRMVFYAAEGGIELAYYLLLIREEEESLFDTAHRILDSQLLYQIEEENQRITVYLQEDLFFILNIDQDEDVIIFESTGHYRKYEDIRRIKAVLEREEGMYSLVSWQELIYD